MVSGLSRTSLIIRTDVTALPADDTAPTGLTPRAKAVCGIRKQQTTNQRSQDKDNENEANDATCAAMRRDGRHDDGDTIVYQ